MNTYDRFNGKRILIWGYGREGRSTERFLHDFCTPKCVDVFEGKREDIDEDLYDHIIKSPGIVMEDDDSRYTSQTQIFLESFRKNTIGITGTKGKSTTSALMYHVLKAAGKKTILLGNIGEPCLDHFGEIDDETIVVFEMSCHQLAHVTVSPHIAVFLNLFEEHLDYYKTFERYFAAKANIAKYQTDGDFLFAGSAVPKLPGSASITKIDSADVPGYDLGIRGHHNDYNAHFVYTIASSVFHIEDAVIRSALSDFRGLAHRLQFIGSRGGIDFYDDSISTIPNATIQALSSVPNAKTVIIGGMDRGINYDILIDHINSRKEYNYILAYASGKRIYESLNKSDNCFLVSDLKEAVDTAVSVTKPGDAVILSPASASYDHFKNFEERGDTFRKLCKLDKLTVTFTGDIGFDKHMLGKWDDKELLSSEVLSFIKDTDHLVVNVEGPLYDGSKISREGSAATLMHSMDPQARTFLDRIGADVWNICNNHIMDAGPEGIKATLGYASESGARTLGAGMNIGDASAPVIFDAAGGIGLIGVGYQRACRKADNDTPGCFSWSDLELIRKRIEQIREKCRWCIVVAHAGEEFTALPAPYTRQRYIDYLDMGADIVIAHHPHVVNNYEMIGDKAIFYSLGNFIFDTDYQRSQFGTQYGIILKLIFTPDAFSFEPLGIEVDRDTERIRSCSLPGIFTDVCEEEYEKLKGLAAKVFIENTKRQLRYMKPEEFKDASEDDFVRNFYEPLRSGRVPGETLDMQIMYPLSQTTSENRWKESRLPDVVKYMTDQLG